MRKLGKREGVRHRMQSGCMRVQSGRKSIGKSTVGCWMGGGGYGSYVGGTVTIRVGGKYGCT